MMLFDEPEEDMTELPLGGRAASTPETRARYAFLRSKKLGSTCEEEANSTG